MPDKIKKRVAFSTAALWILLSFVCFSDEFGFLQGAPGGARPMIEKTHDVPSDRDIYLSDELPGAPAGDGFTLFFTPFAGGDALQPEPPPLPSLPSSKRVGAQSGPKLFQLLSTYRI